MRSGPPLGLFVAALVVLSALGLALLPSEGSEVSGSALSPANAGRRGLFLVLQEVGIPVAVWDSAPGELEGQGRLLWLPQAPEPPEGLEALVDVADDHGAARRAIEVHHPRQYRRFLDEGGTILCALSDEAAYRFAREELGLDLPDDEALADVSREGGTLRLAPDGEELDAPNVHGWAPGCWDGVPGAVVLAVLARAEEPEEDEPEPRAALVRLPVGRGALLALASARFSNNRRIRDGDHALFAARIAERFGGGKPVLFDDYALGRWTPDSAFEVASSPRLLPLTAHVLVLLVVFAWYRGWPRAFARDPVPELPLSALARARAEAGLALRSRRVALLAARLRDGTLAELSRRLRVRGSAGDGESDSRERLRALLGTGAEEDEVGRWTAALAVGHVATQAELERYARVLDEFAARVAPMEASTGGRRRGARNRETRR